MFGIDLWDASLAPALLVAAAAGTLSFLSPCVLPIVPPYLAFMAGTSLDEAAGSRRPQLLRAAAFFVLGLSTVFLLLGLAASTLGRALLAWQEQLTMLAGAVIVLFGLHFLGLLRIPLLDREARLSAEGEAGTALGAYVFGLAFAFGWTPCIGPVLGAILTLSASTADVAKGSLLLAVYSLGLGVPFLLAALFTGTLLARIKALGRAGRNLQRAAGGLLIAMGLLMMTGQLEVVAYWLLETFPALANIG
jgi:cytochrome c-type biogenesis protein